MAVLEAGSIFLEPLPGYSQPTPLAAFVANHDGTGDATGGTHTVEFNFSQDLVWIPRLFSVSHSLATAVDVSMQIAFLAFDGELTRSFSLAAGGNEAGVIFEIPKWLCRPDGADVRVRFQKANVDAVRFRCYTRWYGFQKTVLRDFSAAELLGFVL